MGLLVYYFPVTSFWFGLKTFPPHYQTLEILNPMSSSVPSTLSILHYGNTTLPSIKEPLVFNLSLAQPIDGCQSLTNWKNETSFLGHRAIGINADQSPCRFDEMEINIKQAHGEAVVFLSSALAPLLQSFTLLSLPAVILPDNDGLFRAYLVAFQPVLISLHNATRFKLGPYDPNDFDHRMSHVHNLIYFWPLLTYMFLLAIQTIALHWQFAEIQFALPFTPSKTLSSKRTVKKKKYLKIELEQIKSQRTEIDDKDLKIKNEKNNSDDEDEPLIH